MKKFLSLLIFTTLLFCHNPNIIYAQSTPVVSYEIEYISEDIYIETFITESINNSTKSTTTVTRSKVSNIKNNNDEILTSFQLTGTFIYDHSTSRCTNVSCTTTIYDDTWKFTSTSATKSGFTANGSYTVKQYLLGNEINSISRTLTISCDAHGNVY
jgi:hypothetical protein